LARRTKNSVRRFFVSGAASRYIKISGSRKNASWQVVVFTLVTKIVERTQTDFAGYLTLKLLCNYEVLNFKCKVQNSEVLKL